MGILRHVAQRIDDSMYTGQARRAFQSGQSMFLVDLPAVTAQVWIERILGDGQWLLESTHSTTRANGIYSEKVVETRFRRAAESPTSTPAGPSYGNPTASIAKPPQRALAADLSTFHGEWDSWAHDSAPNLGDEIVRSFDGTATDWLTAQINAHGVFKVIGAEYHFSTGYGQDTPDVRLRMIRISAPRAARPGGIGPNYKLG
jgi:hypothetical protein